MRRWIAVLLLAAGLARASEETLAVFDACWRTVRARIFDPGLCGPAWDAARERYRPRADRAAPGAELRRVLEAMLAGLEVSHAAILEGSVFRSLRAELTGQRALTCGVVLEESLRGRLFVRALFEGGPGARAGLRFGDRVVSIDGESALDSDKLVPAGYDPARPGPALYFLRAEGGAALRLLVQPSPDAATRREVRLVPAAMNGVDATRNSVRVVEREGRRLGVAHVWYCQRGVVGVLRDALAGPLADCEALVLDLRGRGGFQGVADAIAALFERDKGVPPVWAKPVVFLVDGRTRSAKELLAHRIRTRKLGPLVGERTEGAVLAAGFFPLPDGTVLELPIRDVVVDGVRLEGVGVSPDHEVDTLVPYARGRDAVFEKGLAVALESLKTKRARRFVHANAGARAAVGGAQTPTSVPVAGRPATDSGCSRTGSRGSCRKTTTRNAGWTSTSSGWNRSAWRRASTGIAP